MNLFKRNNSAVKPTDQSALAEVALNSIHDGVVITDRNGVIQYVNPAAVKMTNCGSASNAVGLDYGLVLKLESKEGRELPDNENPLVQSMKNAQPLEYTQVALITVHSEQRIPVAIAVQITGDASQHRIITFRNITRELEEEGEQAEFISTASHEMRTPVATIDGYLSLALNPQTASIDERARGYLAAAEKASKHLGKLFQDLLDVTKLDDGRIKPHFVPVEMVELVRTISNDYVMPAKAAKLAFNFGSSEPAAFGDNRRMAQVVYGYVDVVFIREILDNLIGNAIKYTPSGGSIYINVRGDGDRVLINVTDTGIGISAEDLAHIFQKFYRVDNSDTREIGGTGLGLYLVKQRAEAMGGKVWAESAFGEGSTFYVSLPRITEDEYNKRMIAVQNQQMMAQAAQTVQPTPAILSPQPVIQTPTNPAAQFIQAVQTVQAPQPTAQPAPQPALQPIVPTQSTAPPAPQSTVPPQPVLQLQPAPQPAAMQAQLTPEPQSIQSTPQSTPILQATSPPPAAPIPPPATPPPIAPPTPTMPLAPVPTTINNNLNGEIK